MTRLRHKIVLLLSGIAASFILLEIILRVGGAVFLFVQGVENKVALDKKGGVRILCLGESMTALGGDQSYPRQLERILNTRQGQIRFTVIDKGIPSITTSHIIANLEKYLDEYQPQVVTVMMGINDGTNFKPVYDERSKPWSRFLYHFQTYKFFKLLKAHLTSLKTDWEIRNVQNRLTKLQQYLDTNPTSKNYTKLAALYRVLLKWNDEEKALRRAVELDPCNYEALGYLGVHYRRKGEYAKSVEYFRRAVDCSPPGNDIKVTAYSLLAEAYTLSGQYREAEATHLEAMKNCPKYLNGYYFIGDLYFHQNKYREAIALFRKELETNPASVLTYGKLAYCLRKEGFFDTAERLLRQGIKLNPRSAVLYAELSSHLIEQKKYAEAEKVLEKGLSLKKDSFEGIDINLLDYLLASYEGQGKKKEAARLKKIIDIYKNNCNEETYMNYQKLQKILARRNIVLVAVQYPLRDVAGLVKMLNSPENTIIVDNNQPFREALKTHGYDYLFQDRFAGDFGHCTPAGNRLIAEDIATAILKRLE